MCFGQVNFVKLGLRTSIQEALRFKQQKKPGMTYKPRKTGENEKTIKSTFKYTQLTSLKDDDYTCKAVTTVKEASELIENGFEYVTELQGIRLFRKRK